VVVVLASFQSLSLASSVSFPTARDERKMIKFRQPRKVSFARYKIRTALDQGRLLSNDGKLLGLGVVENVGELLVGSEDSETDSAGGRVGHEVEGSGPVRNMECVS
jgi:hypothetical protein